MTQASLSLSLGEINPDELETTLADWMDAAVEDKAMDSYAGIRQNEEGVDYLPANIELSGMETRLINAMSREFVLKEALRDVRKDYDFILIDCMPSLGMMTINALVAADSVIIPSQPSFLSAKGLNLLLHTVSRVKRSINSNLKIDGILLTMVDYRTNNDKNMVLSLRNGIGQNIHFFDTEIPHSVRAAECAITGESIFSHDKTGKVAEAYEKLTKEVMAIETRSINRSEHDWVR